MSKSVRGKDSPLHKMGDRLQNPRDDCKMRHLSLPRGRLPDFIQSLQREGYEVVGPRVEQDAIVYGPIRAVEDLPIGWTDRQGPGSYRIEKRADNKVFGFAVGPHSWKKYLFPSRLPLWSARRTGADLTIQPFDHVPPKRAFIGVRACELHAIAIQDRVFLERSGQYTDPHYQAARENVLLIGVECTDAADTCFCTSMGTGPQIDPAKIPRPKTNDPSSGNPRIPLAVAASPVENNGRSPCDIIMTELAESFVIRGVSPVGERIIDQLMLDPAPQDCIDAARQAVANTSESIKRRPEMAGVQALLHRNQEHPRWDDVASRCLGCTNCTMVCPTCFCSSVEDTNDLTMESAERVRQWDSCFNPEFASVHGGNYRPSIRGRYRQWLTHKFASWFDQFDLSGCVGCGRCITWCPVGIDVTDEISAIRASDGQRAEPVP